MPWSPRNCGLLAFCVWQILAALCIAKHRVTFGRYSTALEKEVEEALRYLEAQGWRIETGGSHAWDKVFCPFNATAMPQWRTPHCGPWLPDGQAISRWERACSRI